MAETPRPSLQFGGVEFGLQRHPEARVADSGAPFRLLVLGNFSGRTAAQRAEQPGQFPAPRLVDRDNFDDVLAGMNVQLQDVLVGSDGTPFTLRFRELDDFEPDRLFEQLDLFATLRQTRRQLQKTSTFKEAAERVRYWLGDAAPQAQPPAPAPSAPAPTPDIDAKSALEEALSATQEAAPETLSTGMIDVDKLISDVVKPYVLEKADPQQAELTACVDELTAELMRSLLHHPSFQTVEAAWRSLYLLIKRLETGSQLKVSLVDVDKSQLISSLTSASDLTSSRLYQMLVEETVHTPGGQPWTLIVGNYEFDATEDDALLAGCLANMAAAAGAPFLAGANPRLFGCESLPEHTEPREWRDLMMPDARQAWDAVRGLRVASSFGLVAPRFLLRRPYGPDSSPIESFAFEELPAGDHQGYLWGNGAMACGYLLAATFVERGWKMGSAALQDIESLPLHIYREAGESCTTPCAEALLTDRAIDAIREAGIMPLASLKDQDRVRLMSFRSIAADGTPLTGRWQW